MVVSLNSRLESNKEEEKAQSWSRPSSPLHAQPETLKACPHTKVGTVGACVKMLKGHLTRVIYHQVYWYTKNTVGACVPPDTKGGGGPPRPPPLPPRPPSLSPYPPLPPVPG